MSIISSILGFSGFGIGVSFGIVAGYYIFFHFEPTDVQDPLFHPLAEQDSKTVQSLLPEIPFWVKKPDYDRVDWLNKFLEYMWPFMDMAICKMAKEIAKPIIAEQIPQYKIDSVEFEQLTLGTLPPTLQDIKVYLTEEKELMMELSIKWAANPNILIGIKAFGMKATAQVVDLQVFAIPRITLKPLVPSFPCFSKIHVSLMDKPHVDFGMKLLGADLMSIPGVYRLVQELVKDQVASMYLWPKTLEVTIMDPATAAKRPIGILHVKVMRAMKLRRHDLFGTSDPYVKVSLTKDKPSAKKTTVKHKNLNPEWNEEFNLSVFDPQSQSVKFKVYDWDQVGSHDKMGLNVVPLNILKEDEPKEMILDLLKNVDPNDHHNDKSRGQLVVELTYKEFENEVPSMEELTTVEQAPEGTPVSGGLLVVIVHEAEDLEGKHHTNPYVKLLLKGESRKTKIVKKNRDPRWGEEFQFTLDEPPVNEKLHVEAFSYSAKIGRLHPKESLGYIHISLEDVVSNKRINEKYHLIDSKNGRIQIEMQWRTS